MKITLVSMIKRIEKYTRNKYTFVYKSFSFAWKFAATKKRKKWLIDNLGFMAYQRL